MMDGAETTLLAALREAERPEPILTVSQWAAANRVLDSTSSAAPGRWRNERMPMAAEVMDRLSFSDPVQRVVLWCAAQMIKTETILNWEGYKMDCHPGASIIVEPTVELMQKFSKDRFSHMIELCPSLHRKVGDPRARDSNNTILAKAYPGGITYMIGANSPVGFRSTPAGSASCDEIDSFPGDVGGEGDPIALLEARMTTWGERSKLFLTSTCTIKGLSRIERAFAEGDQRRYYVPCPRCGSYQTLTWAGVTWARDAPLAAWYECAMCKGRIENGEKTKMLAAGEWRAHAPFDGVTTSYHLNGLYSPVGWLTWGKMAKEFLRAQGHPSLHKTWTNTRLAETWDDRQGQGVEPGSLLDRREEFNMDELDPEVRVITMGVDVQDDRLEVETVAWAPGYESWSIDYTVIPGDPTFLGAGGPWLDLDELRKRTYTHPTAGPMKAAICCVDTGGHVTGSAYTYVRTHARERVFGVKGGSTAAGGMRRPIWPKRPTKNNKGKIDLYMVGVDAAKEDIFARLRVMIPGPGYCHFPVTRDADYFTQLTIEHLQVTYHKGRELRAWVKPDGVRNEALDCRVYAYCALHAWFSFGRRLDRPLVAGALPAPEHRTPRHDQTLPSIDHSPGPAYPQPEGTKPKPKHRPDFWSNPRRGMR